MTHEWKEGELCTATYKNVGEGIIYRVMEVTLTNPLNFRHPASTTLKLKPVVGVIASIENRRTRELPARYCQPLSLVDMAMRYMEFGTFIREEALRRGAQSSPNAEEVPTREPGGETPGDDGAGPGLCADFSARFEEDR